VYPGFVEQLKNDSVNKDRGIYDFEVRSFWLSVIKLLTGVIKLLQVYCYLYIDQKLPHKRSSNDYWWWRKVKGSL